MTRRALTFEARLGLLMVVLLVVGVAAIAVFSYGEMRRSALDSADQRLRDVTRQLAGLIGQQARTRNASVRTAANNPAISDFLGREGRGDRASVAKVVAPLAANNPQVTSIELWNSGGRRLFSDGTWGTALDTARVRALLPSDASQQTVMTSALFVEADTLQYVTVAAVLDGTRPLGYLVQRQRVAGSASARDQLHQLIGSEAALYVGNAAGDIWMDLSKTVPAPPVAISGDTLPRRYDRPGAGPQLAASRRIDGVPWFMLVEFPREAVLRRTRAFATRVAVAAAILFLVVAALGWRASRGLARPLEQSVLESEARFRAVFESAPNGVLMVDRAGGIVLANAEIERLFGYGRAELIGQPVQLLVPPRFHAKLPGARDAYFGDPRARAEAARSEVIGIRRGGTEFPVEIGQSSVETRGDRFVVATVVDISDRRRREEAQRQADEELRRSNEELARFAYVASHDLQEPLRTVTSYVQLIARRYGEKLDGDAREFITYAVEGAARMQRLIEDLLTFSRVGTRGSAPMPVDANEVVTATLSNLKLAIDESGATVTMDRLPTVLVDPFQLHQLFANLIGNAVKFHGAEPPHVHISAREEGSRWVFSVRDNGIGIDPKYFDRIFVVFQRLHVRDEFPGTGIGLAICKKIVERHGGRIWVDSQVGGGSTFRFTLLGAAVG